MECRRNEVDESLDAPHEVEEVIGSLCCLGRWHTIDEIERPDPVSTLSGVRNFL